MDVFPELLGEKEFKYFTDKDYEALDGVLDDTLAEMLQTYLDNDSSDAVVKEGITTHLGSSIRKLTMHLVIQRMGIPELVGSIFPDQFLSSGLDLDEVISQLTFLEQNYNDILTAIPSRSKDAYLHFIDSIVNVVTRIETKGDRPTYPDIIKRVQANSFLFYTPNERPHATRVGVIYSKRKQWTLALNGAKFTKRCIADGVSALDRRRL